MGRLFKGDSGQFGFGNWLEVLEEVMFERFNVELKKRELRFGSPHLKQSQESLWLP